MKKVAKTIKKHLWGILNAIVLKVSNGPAEGINSRIKAIKVRSHGFRNKERFANAIYFPPWRTRSLPRGHQPATVTHLILVKSPFFGCRRIASDLVGPAPLAVRGRIELPPTLQCMVESIEGPIDLRSSQRTNASPQVSLFFQPDPPSLLPGPSLSICSRRNPRRAVHLSDLGGIHLGLEFLQHRHGNPGWFISSMPLMVRGKALRVSLSQTACR